MHDVETVEDLRPAAPQIRRLQHHVADRAVWFHKSGEILAGPTSLRDTGGLGCGWPGATAWVHGHGNPMGQEDVVMSSHDPHSHSHGHDQDHSTVPSDPALRVKALESLLIEKGLVDSAALDAVIEYYEHKVGPRNGAHVVARAWTDPAYKTRLLTDATAAIAELEGCSAPRANTWSLSRTPPATAATS